MAQREKKSALQIPEGKEPRVGIVQSLFNSDITNQQVASAEEFLSDHGIAHDTIQVSGCYEIPYALQQQAISEQYDVLVALGCLVKGGTIHFEVISYSVSKAILDLTLKHNTPIGFGIITANTQEQAQERTWIGYDATYAAVDAFLRSND
jgi:6,7-dimethyl-8-ribityllumazine synthase